MTAMHRISAWSIRAPCAWRPTDARSTARTGFLGVDGRALPTRAADEYAIRFHLHPAIKASRLADGYGVMLLLPDRELWSFNTYGDPVEIEESVFLAGSDGPRRAVQIVIYGHARESAESTLVLPSHPAGRPDPDPRGGRAGIAVVGPAVIGRPPPARRKRTSPESICRSGSYAFRVRPRVRGPG